MDILVLIILFFNVIKTLYSSKDGQTAQKLCDIRNYIENHNKVILKIAEVIKDSIMPYELDKTLECPIYYRRDCSDIYKTEGIKEDGIYSVYPDSMTEVKVYCDMSTAGGGWTVFQNRQDGSVDFNRTWDDYKHGFGELDGEFWLGNDKLALLTAHRVHRLRIDLEDFDGGEAYAEYNDFLVLPENRKYRLVFAAFHGYNGTAGDSLWPHGGNAFSTYDRDNDVSNTENCSQHTGGGFWFYSCQMVGLNNPYSSRPRIYPGMGIVWREWHGSDVSLKHTEMKFRPMHF